MSRDIKQLKPNPRSKFKQEYFRGAKKYFGPQPIIYRSSYEYKFMIRLEMNPNVIAWSSENLKIPYYLLHRQKDGSTKPVRHEYNIDFMVYTKDGGKYIVEVKPMAFVPLNEAQIRRSPEIYKNYMKWQAAKKWAGENGFEFVVVTERDLGIKKF